MERIFDVARSDFRSERAVDALDTDQCIQIKRAFPLTEVGDFAAQASAVFARATGDGFNNAYQVANISLMESDAARRTYGILHMIRRSRAWDVIANYLGTPTILILSSVSYLRRVSAQRTDIALPYHQDGLALPDGPDYRLLSLWMLLSPESCGSNSPGLEFLIGGPKRKLKFEAEPSNAAFKGTQSSLDEISAIERSGAKSWIPEISVGDCMLFSQWNPHRAHVTPQHQIERYSFETRIMADNEGTRRYLAEQSSPTIEVLPTGAIGPLNAQGTRGALPW